MGWTVYNVGANGSLIGSYARIDRTGRLRVPMRRLRDEGVVGPQVALEFDTERLWFRIRAPEMGARETLLRLREQGQSGLVHLGGMLHAMGVEVGSVAGRTLPAWSHGGAVYVALRGEGGSAAADTSVRTLSETAWTDPGEPPRPHPLDGTAENGVPAAPAFSGQSERADTLEKGVPVAPAFSGGSERRDTSENGVPADPPAHPLPGHSRKPLRQSRGKSLGDTPGPDIEKTACQQTPPTPPVSPDRSSVAAAAPAPAAVPAGRIKFQPGMKARRLP